MDHDQQSSSKQPGPDTSRGLGTSRQTAGTTLEGSAEFIGEFLVRRGVITESQLAQALTEQKRNPKRMLGELLVEQGHIRDTSIIEALRFKTKANVKCSKCGRSFEVYYHNPGVRYTCKACGGNLQTMTPGQQATLVLSPGAAAPQAVAPKQEKQKKKKALPTEVAIAGRDPKRIFGKYIVVKELGRGGAAVVYKAWDQTFAQFVALKFIRSQDLVEGDTSLASTEVQDFEHEARLAARLRHPNIVRIYEMGTYEYKHYLSMELIEGGNFFEFIHGKGARNTDTRYNVNPEQFLRIFRDVCQAVHYAHSQNPPVIHRDLKPHNILMDPQAMPYVADFGLAKEEDLGRTETVTGVVKGTPAYMAPEQAEGHSKESDPRTDVYSLGAILYEILTGRPPFVGGNVRQVLNQIVMKEPDRPNEAIAQALQSKADGPHRPKPVPKDLETICMKALEKKKVDRYESAKALGEDIDRVLQKQEIEAREPGMYRKFVRKMKAHPLVSGGVAALVFCAIAASAAVYFWPESKADAAAEVVAIARDHLGKKDWGAVRSDVESLRALDPEHETIAELEHALALHDADQTRRREAWAAAVQRLKTEPVPAVLEELRGPYREAGTLQGEFLDQLDRALFDRQTDCIAEARTLVGVGARVEWLDRKVKSSALSCQEAMGHLASLKLDADFPFQASANLATWQEDLGRILAYRGLWDLRVNVDPFARVVVRRGDQVVMDEWTPLGRKGLRVESGYKLELTWPDREKPDQTIRLDLDQLQHGKVVVVRGDIRNGKVTIAP